MLFTTYSTLLLAVLQPVRKRVTVLQKLYKDFGGHKPWHKLHANEQAVVCTWSEPKTSSSATRPPMQTSIVAPICCRVCVNSSLSAPSTWKEKGYGLSKAQNLSVCNSLPGSANDRWLTAQICRCTDAGHGFRCLLLTQARLKLFCN